ncbi:MAG TPA: head GIN domain-containing protein [Lentimicrobium sp.]|nr:head GIN domain-containing protein [Lentimicrobium sp.]
MRTISAQRNMILGILFTLLAVLTFSLTAMADKQVRNPGSFSNLEVSGPIEIKLIQSNSENLVLNASTGFIDKVITAVKGNTLEIKLEPGVKMKNGEHIMVEVTFKSLNKIDISGAVKVVAPEAVKFEKIELEGSGASSYEMTLSASMLKIELSGASSAQLRGTAPRMEVELSGASLLDAEKLTSSICFIDCSGACNARVNASDELNVEASGASNVLYSGNPARINKDLSGASKMNKL